MTQQLDTLNPAALVAGSSTIADAEAALAAAGITILDISSALGDDWGDVVDKETLIGRPFLIVEVKFHTGDFGDYAACLCMDADGRKFVFTDGSTGVYTQLLDLRKDDAPVAYAARKGLRKSEYEKNGRQAHTFYLA